MYICIMHRFICLLYKGWLHHKTVFCPLLYCQLSSVSFHPCQNTSLGFLIVLFLSARHCWYLSCWLSISQSVMDF